MIPPCFERVSSSIIAVKRATSSHDGFVAGDPIIDDIVTVHPENEEVPDDYILLEHDHQIGYCGDRRHADLCIAYRQREPMGVADTRYVAELLDRYPAKVRFLMFTVTN